MILTPMQRKVLLGRSRTSSNSPAGNNQHLVHAHHIQPLSTTGPLAHALSNCIYWTPAAGTVYFLFFLIWSFSYTGWYQRVIKWVGKARHSIPVQAEYIPRGFLEEEGPRFRANWHMKVVRLSALRTGNLIPQEIPVALISVRGWVDRRGHVRS